MHGGEKEAWRVAGKRIRRGRDGFTPNDLGLRMRRRRGELRERNLFPCPIPARIC